MRSEPAEAAPNGKVAYSALVAAPGGEVSGASIDWAFCTMPKPLADLGDVAVPCFVLAADYLVPLGVGPAAAGKIPGNACHQFGPDGPESAPGQPPGRPVDPDGTGGYYQPVRLIWPNGGDYLLAAGVTRLGCGLAGATTETLAAFKTAYVPNTNPSISRLTAAAALVHPDKNLNPGGVLGAAVGRGKSLELHVFWPTCDTPPCAGAEPYAFYDPAARALGTRREAMLASWFATGGTFASDRTGPSESGLDAANTWIAPDDAGDVTMWIVLRDDRGGSAWQRYRFHVE